MPAETLPVRASTAETARLDQREQDNGMTEIFSCKHALSFKKGKNVLKAIQRSSELPLPSQAQGARRSPPLFQGARQPLQKVPAAGPHSRAQRARQSPEPPQWAQKSEHQSKEDSSPALRLNGICLARFGTVWTPFILPIPPFGMRISILFPTHHCILKAPNLSGFTRSQLEGNFAQNELNPESHPYLT